jgi:uncharacterized protein (TIGR03437 family)
MRTNTLALLLSLPALATGEPVIVAVLNGASYTEVLAPGCWVSIYGTDLALSTASASSTPLPTNLGATSVTVDGHPAALLYVSPTQVNALIPFNMQASGFKGVPVVVTTPVGTGTFNIYVNGNAPALFTVNSAGTGRAHVFDTSFRPLDSLIEQDVIILYATGLGNTDPPASSDTGAFTASRVLDPVEVFLGDQQAEVLFAGLAPGFPGVYQLNVRVPALWTDRLYLRQGGWLSNVVQVGLRTQLNADHITASIEPVLPGPISPVYSSLPLLAARFQVELNVRAGAGAFVVAAVAEGGGSFTRIDPANGMSETYWTTPTAAAAHGDFSSMLPSVVVMDFIQGCQPFPNNQIPMTLMDPGALNFITYNLSPPDMTFPLYAAGTSVWTRGLQPGGKFIMSGAFGDFFQIPCGLRKTGKTTFAFYVDGRMVASQEVAYPIVGR